MTDFDPRVTPARPDLAAAYLKGKVQAARYAEGEIKQAIRGNVALRGVPSFDAQLHTEILFGELFTVYEEKNGWVWGQAMLDSYVGYARASEFAPPGPAPTHRVSVFKTPLLPAPDTTRGAVDFLPFGAKVAVLSEEERYTRIADGLYVFSGHLVSLVSRTADWVAIAERFAGVSYLWGGKTVDGLDCSGLIQLALEAGGIRSPRDADLMEAALGTPLRVDAGLSGLRRGDLVFWHEHVGVMLDDAQLLHANGFHMLVESEPLAAAAKRIAATSGPIRVIKRS
ncbi:MAG: C40 family peptidase [Alphaproteobacteria bacterium]